MPKSQKPKATPPHRMVLRRRSALQLVTSAGPSHIAAASSNLNPIGAASLPADPVIQPSPSLPDVSNTGSTSASAPLPATTRDVLAGLNDELADTQILASENRFTQGVIALLANVDVEPANPEPSTQRISRVSRMRGAFAQLGDLDPPPSVEEEATQVATQAVASIPFSQNAIDGLANIHPPGSIAQEPGTQVVSTQEPFSEGVIRQWANVQSVQASVEQAGTQVVPSGSQFSERMVAELGNVDLANINLTQPDAAGDDDYGYDDGTTIRTSSQVAKSRTPSMREVVATPSKHSTVKSWASGSLTTSMREFIGLSPKPLKNGKTRPVPEDLGPAPPRWPCTVTVHHSTCGHTHKTVVHSHICYYYEEKPGQRVYKEPTPEQEVLDEWGLPPSAQPPARTQKTTQSQSQTQVMTGDDEDCFESTSSIILTGRPCETCRAERVGGK